MTAVETEVVDATVVDEHAAEPHHTVVGAALERRPVAHEVIRPLDVEDVVGSMRDHQELLRRILDVSDWQGQPDAKGSFVKKSGWRKIALAYNLSLGRVGEEVERDEQGMPLRATYTAWSEAPNGRRVEATGHCAFAESRFSSERGNTTKLENDMRATAETRAKNRAISDLIGMGKVSAEEVSAGAPDDIPQAHPWGEQADQALGEKAFRALSFLMEDDEERARIVWDKVVADSSPDLARQFFPKAAARALLHAAVAIRDRDKLPEDAPEFDPVRGTLTGEPPTDAERIAAEEFPPPEEVSGEPTIDPAHAADLFDAIVAQKLTAGAIRSLLKNIGVAVTNKQIATAEGLLDITSGLTPAQATDLERLLKEMAA